MTPISGYLLALAGTAATVAAQDLGSFLIPSIESHQPNGAVDGETNYYNMAFTVNSTISGSESGYCHVTWGDNDWTSNDAFSDGVPADSWIQCDSSAANFGDQDSEFVFQLFPYFSIGNWTFQVAQTYVDGTTQMKATSSEWHVSNTTTSYDYACTIEPREDYNAHTHASGDCSLAANETFIVPIDSNVAV